MMRHLTIILLFAISGLLVNESAAQRRITPVTPNSNAIPATERKKDTPARKQDDKKNLVEFKDTQGNTVLVDTISGREYIDSTAIKEKNKLAYPLFHEVTVGLNLWDPIMRCFGQKYGGAEIWGELSIHNRFKPVVEIGLGTADYTPEDGNYTYKSSTSPYFRIGMNYNFLYKSKPDYQFHAGIRYGFTSFSYEITDIHPVADYWQENATFNIPSQSSTVGFLDIVLGIRVKIVKNLSMGWAFKYHTILHESKNIYGEPWYIPGYGTRTSSIGGSLSVMYTIPLGKRTKPTTDTETAVAE